MGFAYLWALPSAERQFLLRAIGDISGPQWPSMKRQLLAAFKTLDRTGFCIAEGTYERSLNGIAAPLVLQNGTGEPGGSTMFYNLYIYKNFFTFQNMSYGATLAWLLFLVTLVVTLVLFGTARKWVFYAGEAR